ncbi:hypothetical protein J7L70_02905 [Candidatus Bathyarchaeota archaeon]|nr:hypothetical protein [Candidatus Bathyarchaeota archaeon]
MKLDLLKILSNPRRRAFIKILDGLGGEAHLKELARRVVKTETEEPSSKDTKSVYISLMQNHLPILERAGMVSYDEASSTVRLQTLPRNVRLLIEVVEGRDISWSQYYIVLGAASMALSIMFSDLIASVISTCFTITAVIHFREVHYGLSIKRLLKHTLIK